MSGNGELVDSHDPIWQERRRSVALARRLRLLITASQQYLACYPAGRAHGKDAAQVAESLRQTIAEATQTLESLTSESPARSEHETAPQ